MRIAPKAFRFIECGLLSSGLLLLITFSLAHLHRFVMFRAEMAKFERTQLESAAERGKGQVISEVQNDVGHPTQTMNTDHSLWSVQGAKLHQASPSESSDALAVLRIPRLHLEAPVLEGTDELTLNRGVGRIAGTSRPGQTGA